MGSSRKSHIGENNMSNYTVNTEITKSLCEEFYDNSALTLEGLDLKNAVWKKMQYSTLLMVIL